MIDFVCVFNDAYKEFEKKFRQEYEQKILNEAAKRILEKLLEQAKNGNLFVKDYIESRDINSYGCPSKTMSKLTFIVDGVEVTLKK